MKFMIGAGIAAAAAMVLPSAAQAADIPVKAPIYKPMPAAPVATFSWSGVYIGGDVGGAWARHHWAGLNDGALVTILDTGYPPAFKLSRSNLAVGAHAGALWQINNYVLGGEFTWTTSDLETKPTQVSTTVGSDDLVYSRVQSWFTVAAKAGMAFDCALLYVKGGFAGGNLETKIFDTGFPIIGSWLNTQWHTGWTAGAGLEYAVNPNWVVGVEGNYTRFGSKVHSALDSNGLGPIVTRADATIATVLARLSYKVGWGNNNLIARY
jgi:outer membrane immunogenic protein